MNLYQLQVHCDYLLGTWSIAFFQAWHRLFGSSAPAPWFPRGFAIVTYIIKMLSRCRGAWGIPCSRASRVHWKMGLTVKNTWSRAADHVPWRVNCLFSPAGDLTDELLHSTGSEFQSARLLFDSLDNMRPISRVLAFCSIRLACVEWLHPNKTCNDKILLA